jgi:hypothetical protein
VTGYAGTLHFTSTDPTAVLPADYTFMLSDDGTHTFSFTLDRAGTQSVTVTDTSSSGLQDTVPVTVAPGPFALYLMQAPATITAGQQFNILLTAQDAFQNTLIGYNGTVSISSTDSRAALPAPYMFVVADSGTHSFSVTLRTSGLQKIVATDSATNIQSSTTVAVTAAAASKYALSAPQSVTLTIPFNVELTALDPFGNLASSYRGTVHFTSTDASAALPPDYVFTAADSGRHAFSITLKTLGTQMVTATDTVTASITATAQIAASHLSGTGRDLRVRLGQQLVNFTVADFGDDANPSVSALTATINWGDGSTTPGTISGSGGVFTVTGDHIYRLPPEHLVQVTVQDTVNKFGPVVIPSTVRMWPFTQSH